MISVNKTLIGGGGIDGAVDGAAGSIFLDEFQILNCCKTGECKVTLDYKLPAKYVFHTVKPREKNDYKLNECHKSCLLKVFNVKFFALFCGAIVIPAFDPMKAAKVALATLRLWLESNHSSNDHVIFLCFII